MSTAQNPSFLPLDESQKAFCESGDGSVRLLAPAGSGKTQSLLYRCRGLARRSGKLKPKFLVFTFTRAAREELRDRLSSNPDFDELAQLVTITTLNSWGFKLVKNAMSNPRLIVSGKDRYFCIQNVLQPVWRKYSGITSLMEDNRRKSRASKGLLDLVDLFKSLGFRHDSLLSEADFERHIRYLQDCGMSAQLANLLKRLTELEVISGNSGDAFGQVYAEFVPFWRDTCETLYKSALISLEDQKYWARIQLENDERAGKYTAGAGRYHHVFVDEFQDINPLDLVLLKAIAAVNKAEVTIVGDDDQAIYEWRGASPSFILEPQKHLGGKFKTHVLTVNYRSPRNIVELSQRLIEHNIRRVPKQVSAANTSQARIEVRRFTSISQALDSTVSLVHELMEDGKYGSVALVGRKRSQIIPYQIVFAGQNIPFFAAEDLHVLLSDAFGELKSMLGIRARAAMGGIFASDPVQDLLKMADKIRRYPLSKQDRDALGRHLYQARPSSLRESVAALLRYAGPLKGTNEGGRTSVSFAEAVGALLESSTVSDSIDVMSTHFEGLQKDYGKSLEDIFYADPPFLYLSEFAKRYGSDYESFYRDIDKAIATLARLTSDDEQQEGEKPAWKMPLHLMTALRAKGKEFDAVIILDANDGIWPSKLAETESDLEQERRLFYVAMTRARRLLCFVVNDSILGKSSLPSPYLAETGLSVPPVNRSNIRQE